MSQSYYPSGALLRHWFGLFPGRSPLLGESPAPGQKGQIEVTYKSDGTWPGHFKKSITVRTNGTVEMTRLYIEGVMTEVKK